MAYSTEKLEMFNWPVSASRNIAASPVRIWSAISKPGNLEDCHPFCEKNPVSEWPGVGSRDTIYYYSGWILHREFTNWIDGLGYDLVIGRDNGRKSYVSWRIFEGPGNSNTLNITIYPHVLQNIPVPLSWIAHRFYIQPSLQNYLQSVVKGFEWFITTGKPVLKNQFGSHDWFSTVNS
jgi:hypothetical protein